MKHWKKSISCLLTCMMFVFTFSSCTQPSRSHYEGGAVLGAAGAAAGALLDRKNPWRGAVIGGAIGAVAGATMAEISKRAAYEARTEGHPVMYERRVGDSWQRVDAYPQPYRQGTSGRCVLVKTYENGRLLDENLSCE